MRKSLGLLAFGAAAIALSIGMSAPTTAATPDDVIVMAHEIDDMITLDPAEVFEFSAAEIQANIYDRLVTYDPENVADIQPHVAESWEVSEDGLTFTFQIRDDIAFHSGNPLRPEDVAWSLRRVVKLDLTPAFILKQFGFTAENVDERIQVGEDGAVVVTLDQPYAPTFFLYCLTAGVGSVIDMELALQNEVDGDMGHAWLKTNSAGSGPFSLRRWKPNESVILDANEAYWGGAPAVRGVITRHVPEHATQRLMLEKGDIDVARNLEPDQIAALADNPEITIEEAPKGAIYYLGLSQRHEHLAKPEVRQALKYLIDYAGIAAEVLPGSATVHQAFLPVGFLGALEETPFALDVAKAKELLAEAGVPDGFSVTMDTRNTPTILAMAQAIQATFAEAGIELEIIPGDGKQTLAKYRARNHDIYIGRWGPDYQDPHTNASTFAYNPDNSDEADEKPLAWRNAWEAPELTEMTLAAVLETDPAARAELYQEIQKIHQESSPFVIMFQDIEIIASRANLDGMVWGPSFDDNRYRGGVKAAAAE